MDAEAIDLVTELESMHKKARAAIKALGDDGVNWQPPFPETNTAAVIVTHMCGSEAQWVGEYVGGKPARRNRDSEFKQPERTVKGLIALIDRVDAESKEAISKHTSATLSQPAKTGRPDYKGTVRDCVLHALTHESEHVGHLELTGQMWRARKA
jgi:uncharacterized damage-inducible protein DinB